MKSFRLMFASASLLAASVATAGTSPQTANLAVSASVEASCTIDSVSAISFGSYNPANTQPTYAAGSITVSCVKGLHPYIALNSGLNADQAGVRAMKNGNSELLSYQIFKPTLVANSLNNTCNNNETDPWGSADTARLDLGVSPNITPVTYGVCGKIDALQNVGAGTYNDTVIATVTF